ncbi:uncharacterized protein [Miscanthus floridulus]|uniref:uncharacterized protein n=1 Tax=Miscanthus floridulus TaxID=154761 RepID=UPI0034579765
MAPPPPSLMEELVEEVLLRLPPQEPASLVCKPWRRLVSSPRFRCRFLEFHRTPPMLGFICNHKHNRSSFVRTTASSPLHGNTSSPLHSNTSRRRWYALDARHGRVLLRDLTTITVRVLVVWDPITDDQQELPILPWPTISCTAAVLCATATGACDHHGCHRGPFLVVFVGTAPRNMFVCTYSSNVAAWSEPISIQHLNDEYYIFGGYSPSVLVGNELYFGIPLTNTVWNFMRSRGLSFQP